MAMTSSAAAVSFSVRPSATTTTFRPRATVVASASAGAKRLRTRAPKGGKWWAPLVGWSGRADYIETAAPVVEEDEEQKAARPFAGGLTEEKARQLRARMAEMDSFHDAMYHSAIASRLARTA
ncbi:uncharacterized protein LOC124668041 [Lolium rigidum]|uniref:uncharacterized protein LOC124668041 n=1 Tax=Lolium rigidum TaxID=89674 RepID=UPI001F5D4E76|nr:uncharacterized protein LOC124668041 [Lolium rigidum]